MRLALSTGPIALFCGAIALAQAPIKSESRTETLDFSYAFPAEAAAIPALRKRLDADLTRTKAEAERYAREGRALARREKRPFNEHYLHKGWMLLGQSDRLMSLVATSDGFTGGAHGNSRFDFILWDKRAGRAVGPGDLFGSESLLAEALHDRFCEGLNAERYERRQGEELSAEFEACPSLSEITIAPVDANGDGKFDRFRFFAAPYVAGPYVEGSYEVDAPASMEIVQEGLKAEFRSSFEVQPDAQPQ